MKTKRMLSFLLAAVMTATSIPFVAATSVAAASAPVSGSITPFAPAVAEHTVKNTFSYADGNMLASATEKLTGTEDVITAEPGYVGNKYLHIRNRLASDGFAFYIGEKIPAGTNVYFGFDIRHYGGSTETPFRAYSSTNGDPFYDVTKEITFANLYDYVKDGIPSPYPNDKTGNSVYSITKPTDTAEGKLNPTQNALAATNGENLGLTSYYRGNLTMTQGKAIRVSGTTTVYETDPTGEWTHTEYVLKNLSAETTNLGAWFVRCTDGKQNNPIDIDNFSVFYFPNNDMSKEAVFIKYETFDGVNAANDSFVVGTGSRVAGKLMLVNNNKFTASGVVGSIVEDVYAYDVPEGGSVTFTWDNLPAGEYALTGNACHDGTVYDKTNDVVSDNTTLNVAFTSGETAAPSVSVEINSLWTAIPDDTLLTQTADGAASLTLSVESALSFKYSGLSLTKVAYNPLKDADAKAFIDAVEAIGTVTLNSGETIATAAAAYAKLTSTEQIEAVAGYKATLDAATATYNELVAADMQASEEAASAKSLIDAIPALDVLTVDDEAALKAAREAYNRLSDAALAKISAADVEKLKASAEKMKELKNYEPDPIDRDPDDGIKSISGTETIKSEYSGNKYLYMTNKDFAATEGVNISIKTVNGVSDYYVMLGMRATNINAPGSKTQTRIADAVNCTVADTWGPDFNSSWSWRGEDSKLDSYIIKATANEGASSISFTYGINGGLGDSGGTFDVDDIVVYYFDSESKAVEIARFDFEDTLLEKNGVKLTPGEKSNGKNMYGPLKLEVLEEHYYSRIKDLSTEEAGIIKLEKTIEPAFYELSGNFRMPYFQITGASGQYTEGTHSATLELTDAAGNLIGTFDIDPNWKKYKVSFAVLEPIDTLKLTLTDSGITDETEYKYAVDINSLKLVQTRSFENTVEVDSEFVDALKLYTTNDYSVLKSEDGFLHIYNRGVSGGYEGFGFSFDGTLNQGETYTIKYRARQPFANDYATTLSLQIAKDGTYYMNDVPATKSAHYANIEMDQDNILYAGSYGIAVIEGWNEYTQQFTPRDGDIKNPDFVWFARFFGGDNAYYRTPDSKNALNPIDIDYIEITDGDGVVIYREDFDGELSADYAQATDVNLGEGSSKLAIAEDDHMTVVDENGVPEIKLSGFGGLEVGKYALTFEARLGFYDSVLGAKNSVASLDMAVSNADGTSASKSTKINTEWSTVTYSFFVTETNGPSEIAVTLSGVEGGVDTLKRFDFRNFSITSQIFELETEDEESLLNGVQIYSVGDTVKTAVYAEDGVTPDGYLHVYDRPLTESNGAGFKLGTPLEGGERYYIVFKARTTEGNGDICLDVMGSALSSTYREIKNKDIDAYYAMPVQSKTPAPYFTATMGVYVKSEWQTYYFEYSPIEDVADPMFAFASNYYWHNDGSEANVRWGSGQYELNQNPFDIDDIVIYKVGDEENPIFIENFNTNKLDESFKPIKGGKGGGYYGAFTYDDGKAKVALGTDVYESVINASETPELNLSGFDTIPAGRYAFSAYVRYSNGYDSSVNYDKQETAELSIIAYHEKIDEDDGSEGIEIELDTFEIGSEWTKVSYVFTIDESVTSMDQVRMLLDKTGKFDYRDFTIEKLEDVTLPPPNPGVVMVYLYKKQIYKITHPDEYITDGSEGSGEPIDVFDAVDYFEGALSAEGIAKWQTSGQNVELKTGEGGTSYITVSNIKNNYQMLTYAPDGKLPAGSYHFKMDLRTTKPGEDTKLRIDICGQTRNVRLTNDWTSLEFLLSTTEELDLTISFRGGPLAFYNKDFDIANLSLLTLDGRKIEMNVFDHSDFEDEATAMIGWSSASNATNGLEPMTYTWMTETVGEGENAQTNSFVRISNRQLNYQQLHLATGVSIEAGETYTISYDIRLAEEGTSQIRGYAGVSGKTAIKLKVGDEGDSDPSGSNYNTYTITNEWKTATSTFVATDSGSLILSLSGGTQPDMTGSFDIDNVVILAKVKPTIKIGGNKYADGDFEDKDTALASWNGKSNETLGWKGQTFEYLEEADGNGYIKVSGREANYQAFTLNTGVKVSEGTTYQITYKIRTSEADEDGSTIRALAGASANKTYKLKVEGEGSDDPNSSWYHSFSIGSEWKTVTCIYVAETDGELGIEFSGGTGVEDIEDVDIDGFEIYEVYIG